MKTLVLTLTLVSWVLAIDLHRFVLGDEGRRKLTYIDESDASKNWSVPTPLSARDLQLIGNNRVLISADDGYIEYDLAVGEKKKQVTGYKSVNSVRRLSDGRTFIFTKNNPVTLYMLDASDKLLKTIPFAGTADLHIVRLTAKSTILLTCNTQIFEVDTLGKIIWQASPPGAGNLYKAVRLANGNTVVSTGFGKEIQTLDPLGKLIKRVQANGASENIQNNFYADFQILKNGNYLVTNWMAHADVGSQGIQLMEIDSSSGKVVWFWKKPELQGSLHQVLLMDEVDPNKLYDDLNGPNQAVISTVNLLFIPQQPYGYHNSTLRILDPRQALAFYKPRANYQHHDRLINIQGQPLR